MPESPSKRLYDLPPFEPLKAVCRQFKIDFVLYGGAAARAAMHMHYYPDREFDLFDLTPLTSDIDLQHTGSIKLNTEIRQAIDEVVPFASWCNWSLFGKEMADDIAASRRHSTRVPLRSITFHTRRAMALPPEAIRDLTDNQVSVHRATSFGSGPLAERNQDIEICGLLLALNALADLDAIAGKAEFRDQAMLEAWLAEPETDEQLERACGVPELGARVWRMLAPQVARMRSADGSGFIPRVVRRFLYSGVLEQFGCFSPVDFFEEGVFSISPFIVGGRFRLPTLLPPPLVGDRAAAALDAAISDRLKRHRQLSLEKPDQDGTAENRIDPAFDLVAFLPNMEVISERVVHDVGAHSGHYGPQDFLHLVWRPDSATSAKLSARGLTAYVLPPLDDIKGGSAVTALASGGMSASGIPWVRMDFQHLTIDRPDDRVITDVVLLQANDVQADG